MQSALDRVVRTLVLSIGIGSVLFTVLGLSQIFEHATFMNSAYSVIAVTVFCGLPPVMAVLSFRVPVRILRILAGTHAVSAIVFLALWIPAMTDSTALNGGDVPWLLNIIAVASSEAALALPIAAAWVYMLVISIMGGVVRFITFGNPDPSQAIQDSIMIVLLGGFMLALIQLTQLAGKDQDLAAAIAEDAATADTATAALDRQRSRSTAATRDDVILALYAAVQNTPESREVARNSATSTLQKLNRTTAAAPLVATTSVDELDTMLRTSAVAKGTSYAYSGGPDNDPLEVPFDVADALVDAMNEALSNSHKHGRPRRGRMPHTTVRMTRVQGGIKIVVADDGRGFNPKRVAVDRLGIRLNILQRVNSLGGAVADVASARGRGTKVTLSWNENSR